MISTAMCLAAMELGTMFALCWRSSSSKFDHHRQLGLHDIDHADA
jgi:hypothetical protein